MTLQAYLAEANLTSDQFAALLGVDGSTVRRYVAGKRIPGPDLMRRIALATGCKVTANDFFGIEVAA